MLAQTAQQKVIATINQALIKLYWSISKYISNRITTSKWGQKTIEQLAAFIKAQEQGIKGFEKRNTRELERQIHSDIFERTSLGDAKLPPINYPKSLTGIFRDSYVLDFLILPASHFENDLETAEEQQQIAEEIKSRLSICDQLETSLVQPA
jgi:predicted nuclease of restriction endonuclease-like (RecB) superfamily